MCIPRIHFQMMNTVNKSTKFTPFQLRFGKSPQWVLPALIEARIGTSTKQMSVRAICEWIAVDVADAWDNLMLAKITQAHSANIHRDEGVVYKAGNLVMLSTINRRRDYKHTNIRKITHC